MPFPVSTKACNMLKKIRIFLATLVFTALSAFFLDVAQLLPDSFAKLAAVQIVPALLAVNVVVLCFLVALTLLLGRVYCSVICPLGILQDIFGRLAERIARKKTKFKYTPARTRLRWGMVAVAVIGPLSGLPVALSLLDPYSVFGRIAAHILQPVAFAVNNFLEAILIQFGSYVLYHMDNSPFSLVALATALVGLLAVACPAWRHGRAYCNIICPVGTILGFLGRRPVFGIQFDADKCSHCGRCEVRCKAGCIDSKNRVIDYSRCLGCMNCLDQCSRDALRFSFRQPLAFQQKDIAKESEKTLVDGSRRVFINSALGVAVLPVLPSKASATDREQQAVFSSRLHPILPPGAQNFVHFTARCTACHACVSKCPSRVLQPALLEYGFGGVLQPLMTYSKGFCNYDCTICTSTCPSGALQPLTMAQKHMTQIGRVVFVEALCIVLTNGTHCGACAEHCPTQAVTMVPFANGLTIPVIDPDICVGCGGCEYICPTRPYRAIYVEGNAVQRPRKALQEEQREDMHIDSFGF